MKISLMVLVWLSDAFAGALWLYASNLYVSSDQASTVLGIDYKTVRALFERFHNVFVLFFDKLNSSLSSQKVRPLY